MDFRRYFFSGLVFLGCLLCVTAQTSFTVGTYNLEKYKFEETADFKAKSEKIVETIQRMNADVVGLVEMGDKDSLNYLTKELKKKNASYPYVEWMPSNDTNLNLAVLSRYPLKQTVHHKKDRYSLNQKMYTLKRGVLETHVQVTDDYTFTVLLTHLKSQVEVKYADQAEIRLKEAQLIREKIIDPMLEKNSKEDFILMGDMNDNYNNMPIQTLIGTRTAHPRMVDSRPIEPNGDTLPENRTRGRFRSVAWTHFYSTEDSYSRLDYILYSPGMRDQFQAERSEVVVVPNWGTASDHRPIKASFSVPKQGTKKTKKK